MIETIHLIASKIHRVRNVLRKVRDRFKTDAAPVKVTEPAAARVFRLDAALKTNAEREAHIGIVLGLDDHPTPGRLAERKVGRFIVDDMRNLVGRRASRNGETHAEHRQEHEFSVHSYILTLVHMNSNRSPVRIH